MVGIARLLLATGPHRGQSATMGAELTTEAKSKGAIITGGASGLVCALPDDVSNLECQ